MRILVLISLFLLNHCTSTPAEKFRQVKVGMTKGEVVEILGAPASTSRKQGLLKWFYYLRPGDRDSKRVLYFDSGYLTYMGPIIPPPISAEEADQLKKPKNKLEHEGAYEQKISDEKLRSLIKQDLKKRKKKPKSSKFEEI